MSITKLISAALHNKQAARLISTYTEADDLGIQGQLILEEINKYFEADKKAGCADIDLIQEAVERRLSSPKHKEMLRAFMDDVRKTEVSAINVARNIVDTKRDGLKNNIANLLLTNRDDEAVALIEEYKNLDEASIISPENASDYGDRVFVNIPVQELLRDRLSPDKLIRVCPESLNNKLDGGALPGHHILIYARPEAGKTLIALNMIAGFLEQGKKVLYAGNEDPLEQINRRIISRITGMTKKQLIERPQRAQELLSRSGYSRLVLAEMHPGTERRLRLLVERFEPDVLVVDQIRNLSMPADSKVNMLEAAATAMRNIGKKYGVLCVSTTQAGDSAEQKLVLGQSDIDNSKTGIPGQVDLMVGVGVTTAWEKLGQRMLSLSKNKLGGNHDYFPVTVDTMTGLVQDMGPTT